MRQIKPTSKDASEILNKICKNFKKKKKSKETNVYEDNIKYIVYNNHRECLESLYDDYDEKATNGCRLEELIKDNSQNSHIEDAETREVLKTFYLDGPTEIKILRQELFKDENGVKNICPFCGKKEVAHLDHYIPKSSMPEFSIHVHNLIPLCYDCNERKKGGWLDNGKRLFINVYYDDIPTIDRIVDIKLVREGRNLSINIELIPHSPEENESERLAKSTVEKLELIDNVWMHEFNNNLRELINITISHYKTWGGNCTIEDFIEKNNQFIADLKNKLKDHEFIKKNVYEIILNSNEFMLWAKDHLQEEAEK